jgi:hypothetical protein
MKKSGSPEVDGERQQTGSTTHERVACHKVSCLIPAKAVKTPGEYKHPLTPLGSWQPSWL